MSYVKMQFLIALLFLCNHFSDCWSEEIISRSSENNVPIKYSQEIAEKAGAGDAIAQYNLGVCYLNGNGIQKNEVEAIRWFLKSAEREYSKAEYNLGKCYAHGIGVTKNEQEAFMWYKKAAERGDAFAQNNLGFCYQYGIGVSKSDSEAFKWYLKSAEQGRAIAQCNVGQYYYLGKGVVKNYDEALKWFKKSAQQGNVQALNNLKTLEKHNVLKKNEYLKSTSQNQYFNETEKTISDADNQTTLLDDVQIGTSWLFDKVKSRAPSFLVLFLFVLFSRKVGLLVIYYVKKGLEWTAECFPITKVYHEKIKYFPEYDMLRKFTQILPFLIRGLVIIGIVLVMCKIMGW